MSSPATACLLLKAPVEGAVKTRLAVSLGHREAVRIYRHLVEQQIARLPPAWLSRICYAPAETEDLMRRWLGAGHEYRPQAAGDLGDRLAAAVSDHFGRHESPLFLLGGDCPSLDTPALVRAEQAMAGKDVVLIPAADGGYVLIGLRKPHPELFAGISWSTEHVLAQTLDRTRAAGLAVTLLPVLEDIDDLASWQRALASGSTQNPP